MLESARKLIFPDQCLLCGDLVQSDGGLCGTCWRDTPFIMGLICESCGAPQLGPDPGWSVCCDDCRGANRPWTQGRAALVYAGSARRLVLGLKHGDRLDLVPVLAKWMAASAAPILTEDMLIAPVPVHWRRLIKRRYNQAAALAIEFGKRTGLPVCPDLLQRSRHTPPQEGIGSSARFANIDGAIRPHPRRVGRIAGKTVLLIDDVMTSGATLTSCARVCLAAGAAEVRVMTLARAVKAP